MNTWKDIRKECLSLGFETDKAYDKNKKSYIDAFNWAQGLIATTCGFITEKLIIEKAYTNKAMVCDLQTMSTNAGFSFSGLADTGVVDTKDGYKINGCFLTGNRFLTVPQGYTGNFTIYVNRYPQKLTEISTDDTPCQVTEKWASLIPYLMANRLYLDDDEGKASYYWNLYDDMKNQFKAQDNNATVTIVGGIDID